jgi:hypothetical protein
MRVVVGDVLSPTFVNPHVEIQVNRKNHVIREGRNHAFLYAPFDVDHAVFPGRLPRHQHSAAVRPCMQGFDHPAGCFWSAAAETPLWIAGAGGRSIQSGVVAPLGLATALQMCRHRFGACHRTPGSLLCKPSAKWGPHKRGPVAAAGGARVECGRGECGIIWEMDRWRR